MPVGGKRMLALATEIPETGAMGRDDGKYRWRPLVQVGSARPADALPLAGGWGWFTHAERLCRNGGGEILAASEIPGPLRARFTASRPALAGISLSQPRLMGILNVTPDSFSDGGRFLAPGAAIAHGRVLVAAGADILDVGGESTRPGAAEVPAEEESARVVPVIAALSEAGLGPVSVDSRKAVVAQAALAAGAEMVNDVSAMGFDSAMAGVVAGAGVPLCLMHARGTPETMQNAPKYANVTFDVYDFLEEKLSMAEAAGIPRKQIVVDPGIGFGKTIAHNLELLRNIAVFHGLGCAILLGVSRKRFIGAIGGGAAKNDPVARMPGSVALAVMAAMQGVQILRVHDIAQTRQALDLAWALIGASGEAGGQPQGMQQNDKE